MEDFGERSRNGDQWIYIKEDPWGKWGVFVNHDFVLGAELPTCGNEKSSCVMCLSEDVPGCPEAGTESSQACDTEGKAVRRSWHEGGCTGIQAECDTQVVLYIPISCSLPFLDLILLGTVGRQEIIINSCLIGWALLIIHVWYSRNTRTLLKWQYLVYYISILVINSVLIQWFPSLPHLKTYGIQKKEGILLLIDNIVTCQNLRKTSKAMDPAT